MEYIIGAGILVGVIVIVVVVPKLVTKAMEPSLERRISKTYSSGQIVLSDLEAVTFGLESRGVLQGRGNGALVLTANELGWFRFVPERSDLRIPRECITTVDTVKAHLGKTSGRDLLRVTFTHDGKPDSMAWSVTDLGPWLTQLGQPAQTAR
jgi:hypothetical protein